MKIKPNKHLNGGIVYSTNKDFTPEDEEQEEVVSIAPQQQNLKVTLDKKLKAGKKATVIYNFVGPDSELETLGKTLKNKCACGGTVKDGEIILQGDFLDKVKKTLDELGYRYKVAGV